MDLNRNVGCSISKPGCADGVKSTVNVQDLVILKTGWSIFKSVKGVGEGPILLNDFTKCLESFCDFKFKAIYLC